MKKKLWRFAGQLKQVLREPWKMRSARINLLLWSICTLVAAANIAMNLLLRTDLMYFWLAVNAVTVLFDVTCLKMAVHGYFWRKEQDAAEAQKIAELEQFNAIMRRTW